VVYCIFWPCVIFGFAYVFAPTYYANKIISRRALLLTDRTAKLDKIEYALLIAQIRAYCQFPRWKLYDKRLCLTASTNALNIHAFAIVVTVPDEPRYFNAPLST
jgi:hypothetical protein